MTDTPMSRHTPEPWINNARDKHDEPEVWHSQGPGGRIGHFSVFDDAERAVSAVNACKGLADPEAEIRHLCQTALIYGPKSGTYSADIARRWLDAHKETK